MATGRRLHEALSGRRLTRLEYEHALPRLQDALLDAQFTLARSRRHAVVMIVTGIPAAGRSEVVNELLGNHAASVSPDTGRRPRGGERPSQDARRERMVTSSTARLLAAATPGPYRLCPQAVV